MIKKRLLTRRRYTWLIRIFYSTFILGLAVYIGLGAFLSSSWARQLALKELSRLVKHPVRIEAFSIDLFHGLHFVLKGVKIPSETPGQPWLTCESIVATIRLLPALRQKKIVFKKLTIRSAAIRIRRTKEGNWQGAFPAAGETGGKGFSVLLPRIRFEHVTFRVRWETPEGKREVCLCNLTGRSIWVSGEKKLSGKVTGFLQLGANGPKSRLELRADYYPGVKPRYTATARFLNLRILPLVRWAGLPRTTRLTGIGRVTFLLTKKAETPPRLRGNLRLNHLIYDKDNWHMAIGGRRLKIDFLGEITPKKFQGQLKLSPFTMAIKKFSGDKREKLYFTRNLTFKNLVLTGIKGRHASRIASTLKGTFSVGREIGRKAAHLSLEGFYDLSKRTFGISADFGNILLPGPKSAEAEKNTTALLLNRAQLKAQGNQQAGKIYISSLDISGLVNKTTLSVSAGPFFAYGSDAIPIRIKGEKIPLALLSHALIITAILPPKISVWCAGVKSGATTVKNVLLSLKRKPSGEVSDVILHGGHVSFSDLSLTVPEKKVVLEGFQGKINLLKPGLRVTDLRGTLDGVCHVKFETFTVKNLYNSPLEIQASGQISLSGLSFSGGELAPLATLIVSSLPEHFPFHLDFCEGTLQFNYKGSILPFSPENYQFVFDAFKINGKLKNIASCPEYPVTLKLDGSFGPGTIKANRVFIDSPLARVSLTGSGNLNDEKKWALDATCNGKITVRKKVLDSFLPLGEKTRLDGEVPLYVRARGIWPGISVKGRFELKDFMAGYRNLFLKPKGVRSSIDFEISQQGPQTFFIQSLNASAGAFALKIWGAVTSIKPLRANVKYQTNSHEIKTLFPLFPVICHDRVCKIASGVIQGSGTLVWNEAPSFKSRILVKNMVVPFPGSSDPVTVETCSVNLSQKENHFLLKNLSFKNSILETLRVSNKRRAGVWLWEAGLNAPSLNFSEILESYQQQHKKDKTSNTPPINIFREAIRFLNGKYIEGYISVDKLTLFKYTLSSFFSRFNQRGNHGEIKGFNFLIPKGYGAIDISWQNIGPETIHLDVHPLAKNFDFGRILTGLLGRRSPFTGILSFRGNLDGMGEDYAEIKKHLHGNLDVTFENGEIRGWNVLVSIFKFLDIYDILFLSFPDFSKKGLAYDELKGTIEVSNGIATTQNARLKSRPFYMAGEGNLDLDNGLLSLLIGVYPFKMLDAIVSRIPIAGRIFTDKNKKVIGYFFKVRGPVEDPSVYSANIEAYRKSIWKRFKKIITLPLYPFQNNHSGGEKNE